MIRDRFWNALHKAYRYIWKHCFEGKSAAWTAIFAFALAVFSYRLYVVAYQADETARATQRAFVSFAGMRGGARIIHDGKVVALQMTIPWENSGTTPAKSGLSQFNWLSWPTDLPKNFNFPDLAGVDKRIFVIGPKHVGSGSITIPVTELDSVRKEKSHLLVWGWITYRDIFPDTPVRLTEFCVEITSVSSSKDSITDSSGAIGWDAVICKEHNCYDEDCPNYKSRVVPGASSELRPFIVR